MASDDAKQYPTIEDFLMARYEEEERWVQSIGFNALQRPWLEKQIRAHRSIVEWHSQWPVLLTTKPEVYTNLADLSPASERLNSRVRVDPDYIPYVDEIKIHMVQQMEWLTQEEYVKRFGTEPPTAPILRHLASVYDTHRDYNPEWSV